MPPTHSKSIIFLEKSKNQTKQICVIVARPASNAVEETSARVHPAKHESQTCFRRILNIDNPVVKGKGKK